MTSLMRALHLGLVAALSATGLLVAQVSRAETIYATSYGNTLVTIDTNTGLGSVVGPIGYEMTWAAAFNAGGMLYTATGGPDSKLGTYNLSTGGVTPIGPTVGGIMGLEFAQDGTLYGVSAGGMFYTINTATGSASPVGSLGFANVMDVDFDAAGTLWAVASAPGPSTPSSLWSINLSTGNGTFVTNISGASSVMGIMFGSDGTLYATDFMGSSNLYSIDVSTGAATKIGSTGLSMLHGGDIFLAAVPEPGIYAMLGIGLGIMGWVARRRKQQAA